MYGVPVQRLQCLIIYDIPNDRARQKIADDCLDYGLHFKLQLAAYALLLEQTWGLPVRRGYIYSIPLRESAIITISPALRANVVQAVAAMRVAVAGEQMPAAPASRRPCVSCEFRRFCNDVV